MGRQMRAFAVGDRNSRLLVGQDASSDPGELIDFNCNAAVHVKGVAVDRRSPVWQAYKSRYRGRACLAEQRFDFCFRPTEKPGRQRKDLLAFEEIGETFGAVRRV